MSRALLGLAGMQGWLGLSLSLSGHVVARPHLVHVTFPWDALAGSLDHLYNCTRLPQSTKTEPISLS